MSLKQSALSDPRFGYDLVVAVTQASVNATLEQLLAGLEAPEVTLCFVFQEDDENGDKIVLGDYEKVVADAQGSDPFLVPPGANPATNPDLINLADANFAGAVRARLGLPDLPLDSIPPVLTLLDGTSAPTRFNLLCSQFQVVGFHYGARNRASWINQSQPEGTGSPWYFSATVNLNKGPVDPDAELTDAVRARITALQSDPTNAFTVQKLFLDLDTAVLESVPVLAGIPAGLPVWSLITQTFMDSYLTQLRQKGDPVLSYSFSVQAPRPATLQLGAVSRECSSTLVDGVHVDKPTPEQQRATALVYLGSTSTTAPVPVPFPWNWVEPAEVDAISGVQAVRRDVFLTFLAGLVNRHSAGLCLDTTLTMTHSHEDFSITYRSRSAPWPGTFRPVALTPPAADGFTTVLAIGYDHSSHDSSTTDSHFAEIWGDYNYSLNGSVAVGGNQIRLRLQAKVYLSLGHREVFVNYTDLPGGTYYDRTTTFVYTLGVDQNGALQVTSTQSTADRSATWAFDPKGIVGGLGYENDLKNAVGSVRDKLAAVLDAELAGYAGQLAVEINGYGGWVFPGNDAFTFKNVAFSSGLDLVTELTYVNPN